MRTFLLIPVTILLLIETGLSVQAEVRSFTVKVDGLACPFCAFGLEKKLKKVEGVEQLKIDVDAGEALLIVAAGTRLVAASGAGENVSKGLVKDVQQAVEEAGFTPRDLLATVEGALVDAEGTKRLLVGGTEESLLLKENDGGVELQRFGAGHLVQVSGILQQGPQELRMTVQKVGSSQSAATVCRIQISGMVCSGCVAAIQAGIGSPGWNSERPDRPGHGHRRDRPGRG